MDLIKAIHDSILINSKSEERNYIGASIIGKPCARAIWYSYKGYDQDNIPIRTKITFDIGKNLEKILIDYIELSGIKIEKPCESNNYLLVQHPVYEQFKGHMDALLHIDEINPIILEIKTAKASSFQKFKKEGLKHWNHTYYAQIQTYMGISGYHKAIILALNKDSSELYFEWVYFDEDYYNLMVNKAQYLINTETIPERINNNSCYFICEQCSFKTVCHYV